MDFNAIRPDGPTIAIEHQATGEQPVHVTPDGIQPAAQAADPETTLNLKAAYDDLVKRLRKEASYWCTNCCYRAGDCICFAPDDRKKDCDVYTKLQAADAIEELLGNVEQLPKWVSVEDALPENSDPVLTYTNFGKIIIGWCIRYTDATQWYFTYCRNGETAKCWMPLPEPPKEVTP